MTDLEHERLRQAELDALELDAFAETAFDDLTHTAAETLKAPIATITIVDGAWQGFKSKVGLEQGRSPRAEAFSDQAIRTPDAFFVVEGATKDPRFSQHPLVAGEPYVRFYAAAPLTLSFGRAIGTLVVMDWRARKVDPGKLEQLKFMADQVVATLEARAAKRASRNPAIDRGWARPHDLPRAISIGQPAPSWRARTRRSSRGQSLHPNGCHCRPSTSGGWGRVIPRSLQETSAGGDVVVTSL